MALNQQLYLINPTKSKTYGLNDTIRYNTYAYTTIYTVLSTETLVIKNGFIGIDYINGATVNVMQVNITIGTKKINLWRKEVAAAAQEAVRFSLNDVDVHNIILATGDTIKIEFIHSDAGLAPTGNITALLYLEDYTA